MRDQGTMERSRLLDKGFKSGTRLSRRGKIKWLVSTLISAGLMFGMYSVQAHNLQTRMTYMYFDKVTQQFINNRVAKVPGSYPGTQGNGDGFLDPGEPMFLVNDILNVVIKVVPQNGTTTGVGGYIDMYVPNGMQVMDAAYVIPDGAGGFTQVPMKGQSLITLGVGAGGGPTPELINLGPVGPNINGVTDNPVVTTTGAHRGTVAGVYGDVGIFYSTHPDTAFGSWINYTEGSFSPKCGLQDNELNYDLFGKRITNNSGDTYVPCNKWDAAQAFAWGAKSTTWTDASVANLPIVDPNGRGNAPWGFASGVAGPESGYAWQFDFDEWKASGKNAVDMRNAMDNTAATIGPWKRIQYPGSTVSKDIPGNTDGTLGIAGIDASTLGLDVHPGAPLPATLSQTDTTSPKTIRFSVGQLTEFRPEHAWVQLKITEAAVPGAGIYNADGCPVLYGDTFGGDAGGSNGGKDHLWRYYEPTRVWWNLCVGAGKTVNEALVKVGDIITYDVNVFNGGLQTQTNTVVRDTLPGNLAFISSSVPQNGGPNPLVWNVGTLQPGQSWTTKVTVQVTGNGSVENRISIVSDQNVSSVTEITPSTPTPFLVQDKSVSPATAAPGSNVQYTLKIDNLGTGATDNSIKITEHLPSGFTYVSLDSVVANGANVKPATTVNSSNLNIPVFTVGSDIKAGQSLLLKFTAKIPANSPTGSFCNWYQTEEGGTPLITGQLACVTVGAGSIGDTIYRDWNNNGAQDAGEEGIAGVTLELRNGICTPGSNCPTTTTNASGVYTFAGLDTGTYTVVVTDTAGKLTDHVVTQDPQGALDGQAIVTLALNQQNVTTDFGYRPVGTASIGDKVFNDLNGNGIHNGGEAGINAVTVNLYEDSNGNGFIDAGDLLIGTQDTSGGGNYNFTGLASGLNYLVDVIQTDSDIAAYFNGANGYPSGTAYAGTSLDPHKVTNLSGAYTLADFGFQAREPGTIGDQLFLDNNGNGIYDGTCGVGSGDCPLDNVTVNLYASNGTTLVASTSSNATGFYQFTALPAGNYIIRVDTTDPDIDSGYAPSIIEFSRTLTSGGAIVDADFPFVKLLSKAVNKSFTSTPGDRLTYTITPNYIGSALLTNVTIKDAMPPGTTYVGDPDVATGSDSPEANTEPANNATGPITWNLGSNTASVDANQPGTTGTWGTPVQIDTSRSANSKDRVTNTDNIVPNAITRDAAGNLYVVFNQDAKDTYFTKATISGSNWGTWSTPVKLPNANNEAKDRWATIAVDSDNRIHVAYDNENKSIFYTSSATGATGTWSSPIEIDTAIGDAKDKHPVIRVDSNKNLYVLFNNNANSTYLTKRIFPSTSWSTPTRLPQVNGENKDRAADLALSSDGKLHVAIDNENKNIYYTRSTNGGTSWSSPIEIDATAGDGNDRFPKIAVTAFGNPVVVYNRNQSSTHFSRSTDGGLTFSFKTVLPVVNGVTQDRTAAVAVDKNGGLHVAVDTLNTSVFYLASQNNGSTWSTPVQMDLAAGADGSRYPSIITTSHAAAGHVHVVGGQNAENVWYNRAGRNASTSNHIEVAGTLVTTGTSVKVKMTLGSTSSITNVTPGTLSAIATGGASVVTGNCSLPTAGGISANSTRDFTWTCTVFATGNYGQITFSAGATGSGPPTTFPSATSNSVIVTPPLTFQVDVDNPKTVDPILNTASIEDGGVAAVLNVPDVCYTVADNGGSSNADAFYTIEGLVNPTTWTRVAGMNTFGIEAITASANGEVLYAADNGVWGTINTSNGQFTAIGSFGTASGDAGSISLSDVDGLAVELFPNINTSTVNGIYYGTHRRGGDDLLFRINPATGAFEANKFNGGTTSYATIKTTGPLGLGDIDDIAIDPVTGILYGIANNGGNDRLVQINKDTGVVTDVGQLRLSGGALRNDMEGLSFRGSQMIGTTGNNNNQSVSNHMWNIDKATGVITDLGPRDSGSDVDFEAVSCPTTYNFVGGSPVIPLTISNEGRTDLTARASIGDFVWRDIDGDGVQDGGAETGIAGVEVCATNAGMTITVCDITDVDGFYQIPYLNISETWTVSVNSGAPAGFDRTTRTSYTVSGLTQGQFYQLADFGYQRPVVGPGGTIGDTLWSDTNGNGVVDGIENGTALAGVTVNLYRDVNNNGIIDATDPLQATKVTDANGNYNFTLLNDGNYLVQVATATLPVGAILVSETDGVVNNLHAATISGGSSDLDADFGYQWTGSIGDTVFVNNNTGNGDAYESGVDTPIPFVTVWLYADNGDGILSPAELSAGPIATEVTDVYGMYDFTAVAPGNYIVRLNIFDPDISPLIALSVPQNHAVTGLLGNQDYNDADFPFITPAVPNLQFLKLVDKPEANPGDTLTYSFTGSREGNEILQNVRLTDYIPPGTTYDPGSAAPGLESGPDPLVWNLGSVSLGAAGSGSGSVGIVNGVSDNFDDGLGGSTDYNGTDGSLNWSNDWQEIGDDNMASTGSVRVLNTNCVTGYCLNIGGTTALGKGVSRQADLSSFTSAELDITYQATIGDPLGFNVEISLNGGASWVILKQVNLTASAAATQLRFDITSFIATNTAIRITARNNTDAGSSVSFDNIHIEPFVILSLDKDTYVTSAAAGNNFGASTSLLTGGGTATALMEFDVSSLAGKQVDTATLVVESESSTGTSSVYAVNTAWVEGSGNNTACSTGATWNTTNCSTAWIPTPGNALNSTVYDTNTFDSADTAQEMDITALAQAWATGAMPNNGVALYHASSTATYKSSDQALVEDRPRLRVTTLLGGPAITGTVLSPGRSITVSGGAVIVTMTLTSDQTGGLVTPGTLSYTATGGATATCGAGTPASQPILSDVPIYFSYNCTLTSGAGFGSVSFTNDTLPFNENLTFGQATANSVIVSPVVSYRVIVDDPVTVDPIKNIAQFSDESGAIPPSNSNEVVTLIDTNAVGDYVWIDLNGDGVQDASEPPFSGITVCATNGIDTFCETTAADGSYEIAGLDDGTWTTYVDMTSVPAGYTGTTPISLSVPLSGGAFYHDADFGLIPPDPAGYAIGDTVWLDNGAGAGGVAENGTQDGTEPGIPGMTVNLYRDLTGDGLSNDDILINTTTTDANGNYLFDGLITDDYVVEVVASGGVLPVGGSNPDTGSIGDTLWLDADGDGNQDTDIAGNPIEAGIAGVTVQLTPPGGVDIGAGPGNPISTTTDANGQYNFDGLPAGDFTVTITDTSGVLAGLGVSNTSGPANPISLLAGEDYNLADFGYELTDPTKAAIGDRLWVDSNGNGLQDEGEIGLAGVTVYLCLASAPSCDAGNDVASAVTDELGNYMFTNVDPTLNGGAYTVAVDTTDPQLTGYTNTGDPDVNPPANAVPGTCASCNNEYDLTIAAGDIVTNVDFGYDPPAGANGSIGDTIWMDNDGNGLVGAGEAGIGGVTIDLYHDLTADGLSGDDILIATTITDANGNYDFTGLPANDYVVSVSDNFGQLTSVSLVSGTDPTASIALGADQNYDAADFGYQQSNVTATYATTLTVADDLDADFPFIYDGSIGDTTFYDTDGDGIQDPGEAPAPDVTMLLIDDANGNGQADPGELILQVTETDASGNYLFDNLPPGNYVVQADEQTAESPTTPGLFSVMVETSGGDYGVTLGTGPGQTMTYLNADFGFLEAAKVEGHVFFDEDHNGSFGSGETGLAGITVTLTGFDYQGNPVTLVTETNADGEYDFIVLEGNYTVTYDCPSCTVADPDIPAGLADETTPVSYNISPVAGEEIENLDFGLDNTGTIGDTVYNDANGNGMQSGGEAGLAGVTLSLYNDTNGDGKLSPLELLAGPIDFAVTNGSGNYLFEGLPDGNYVVLADETTLPAGTWLQTDDPDNAGNCAAACDAAGAATISGGNPNELDIDFGYQQQGVTTYSVGGTLWTDANGNGVIDGGGGEAGDISGVTVTVWEDDGDGVLEPGEYVYGTAVTDGNGDWQVDGIPAGANVAAQVNEATLPNPPLAQTGDPSVGQVGAPCTVCDATWEFTNLSGDQLAVDFGYQAMPASISGTVVNDGNGNGTAEPGAGDGAVVQGVLIELIDVSSGLVIATTTTDVNGEYSFNNLAAGDYQVRKTDPTGLFGLADADSPNPPGTGNPDIISITLAGNQNLVDQDFELHDNITVAVDDDNNTLVDIPVSGDVLFNDFDPNGDAQTFMGFEDPANPGTYVTTGTLTLIPGTDADGNAVADAGDLLVNADGTYTFTPVEGFVGSITIPYQVCDVVSAPTPTRCEIAYLTITVSPLNDPFDDTDNTTIANDDDNISYDTDGDGRGQPVSDNVLNNDADPQGDAISFKRFVSQTTPAPLASGAQLSGIDLDGNVVPNAGVITFDAAGNYTFTPAPGFFGEVQVDYEITDNVSPPNQATATATLTITVLGDANEAVVYDPPPTASDVNDPPFAGDDLKVTPMDTPVNGNVLNNDTDTNGDSLIVSQVYNDVGTPVAVAGGGTTVPTENGSVTIYPDGSYTYTPDAGYIGPDNFSYAISDGNGGTSVATVYLLATPIMDFGDLQNDGVLLPPPAAAAAKVALFKTKGGLSGRHFILPGLRLGATVDGEPDGQPTNLANGDDLAGSDEDSTSFEGIQPDDTNVYRLGVEVTNNRARDAIVTGWMDLNCNNEFDPGERATGRATTATEDAGGNSLKNASYSQTGTPVTGWEGVANQDARGQVIAGNSATQIVGLEWYAGGSALISQADVDNNCSVVSGAPRMFARIRVTSDRGKANGGSNRADSDFFSTSSPTPNGPSRDGEIEDYQLSLAASTTPVMIAEVSATAAAGGGAEIAWLTASEQGAAAFRVERWVQTSAKGGHWTRAHQAPWIPSLLALQGGRYQVHDPDAVPGETYTYQIVEQASKGKQIEYGPYELKIDFGDAPLNTDVSGFASQENVDLDRVIALSDDRKVKSAAAGKGGKPGGTGSTTVLRLEIGKTGIYRIAAADLATYLDLTASKLKDQLKAGQFYLTTGGVDVSWYADSANNLYFYGESIDSHYSATRSYWLAAKGKGPQMGTVKAKTASPVNAVFIDEADFEDNTFAFLTSTSNPEDDYWFWNYFYAIDGYRTLTYPVALPDARQVAASLSLRLYGNANTTHQLQVKVNGVEVDGGPVIFSGAVAFETTVNVPAAAFAGGGDIANVELTLDNSPTGALSSVFLDGYKITYTRGYRAYQGSIMYQTADATQVTGFGSASIVTLDVTNTKQPKWITGGAIAQEGSTWTYRAKLALGEYASAGPAGLLSPVSVTVDTASDLKSRNNEADYVVIASDELWAGAQTLADYRSVDLQTMMVNIQDIYDEFSYGLPDPAAVRQFVAASREWKTVPRYVAIVGDGSFDYQDRLGLGYNIINPVLFGNAQGLHASDTLLGDPFFTGTPIVAVGRIPAKTVAEVQNYVLKLDAYENGNTLLKPGLLLTDKPDNGGNFKFSGKLIANESEGEEIVIDLEGSTKAAVRSSLFSNLQSGVSLMNYVGHGGVDRISKQSLLVNSDADTGINNTAHTPPFVGLSCLINNYSVAGWDSLGERLVLRPDAGMIASWAASGESYNLEATQMGIRFNGIYPQHDRLGDAIIDTLSAEAVLKEVYTLLGDPALRIR